jgi:diguanylate cyclase (GGDEF)-like protein/PAS domain S-box-containing protein
MYKTIFESVPEATLFTDSEGHIMAVNAAAEVLWGYRGEELEGRSMEVLFANYNNYPSSSHIEEVRCKRKDGSLFFALRRISGVYDSSRTTVGYVETFRDITGQKQYRLLVENQNDLIVQVDLQGRIQYMSSNYRNTFGADERELIGKQIEDFIHPEDRDRIKQSLESLYEPPYTTTHSERALTGDGYRWFQWSARAVFAESGEIDSFISVGRDVTEEKKMEEELRRSEEKFHKLFEEAIDGIALAERDTGIIVDCNPALARLVARSKQEIIGQPQSILHPETEVRDDFSDSFKRHRNDGEGEEIETQVITKHGELRDVIIKANSLKIDNTVYLQGVFHDITEYRNALRNIEGLAKFPDENPAPVLRTDSHGIIIYANQSSNTLLNSWEKSIGDTVPEPLLSTVTSSFTRLENSEFEVTIGERIFLFLLAPIEKLEYVNLYGRDITERKNNETKLHQLATTDELTGAHNRRYFLQLSRRELERAKRYGNSLSVLMLDIDHFKKINDTYGHSIGDIVLTDMVAAIRKTLRAVDIFGRVGGEEFAIMLPEIHAKGARSVAERLRKTVESTSVETEKGIISITLSIGIACLQEYSDTLDDLLRYADTALYEAKENGRNRVHSYSNSC